MKDSNLDMQIQEILNKRTYSNDNYTNTGTDKSLKAIPVQSSGISIVGDNNIIINGNLLYMTFVFIIACAWLCLIR